MRKTWVVNNGEGHWVVSNGFNEETCDESELQEVWRRLESEIN